MTFDVHKFIREDWRALSSIYTDPAIFQEEIKRIWRRSWLYVAHESEVPHPGDFTSLTLAQQPVLVVRGEDGQVRVLFNTCRHRAVMVCREEKGNAKHFICAHHGWVYNTKGGLTGLSGPNCRIRRFAERRGLTPVPRVDVYRGFIFASLSPTGESLDEHLGKTKFFIDLLVDQSPEGLEVLEGRRRQSYKENWKLLVENGGDGNQIDNDHARLLRAQTEEERPGKEEQQAGAFTESRGVAEDLGNGHALRQFPAAPRRRVIHQRREELEQRLGPEKTQRLCETGRNLFIFPNLFLVEHSCTSLYIINPVAPDYTEITTIPCAPKGESLEMTNQRLSHYETFLTLARRGSQGDGDAFAPRAGAVRDETVRRGQYRHWLKLMARNGE